ncbi:MAG: hypothetical protein GX119_07125 [Syntrophomonadaceae bacterium]|nr:hypothetical protein [Syntrophomonadaceae bacterium]
MITKEDMEQAPVSQQIILQGNGFTYFSRMPSDVQYTSDNEAFREIVITLDSKFADAETMENYSLTTTGVNHLL